MADLIAQGAAWLDEVRQAHLSQDATYHRGDDWIEIVVTMGATDYEIINESGMVVGATSVDFIITTEALDVLLPGPAPVLPMVGDQFRFPSGWGSVGNEIAVFEVLDLGGAGHYRLVDRQELMMRIHTKRVADMEFV